MAFICIALGVGNGILFPKCPILLFGNLIPASRQAELGRRSWVLCTRGGSQPKAPPKMLLGLASEVRIVTSKIGPINEGIRKQNRDNLVEAKNIVLARMSSAMFTEEVPTQVRDMWMSVTIEAPVWIWELDYQIHKLW